MSSSTDKVLPFDDGGPLDDSTPSRSPAPRQSPQQHPQSAATPQKSIGGVSPAVKKLMPPDVRDHALLPTLARADLEEKYSAYQFQQWMDSGELLFCQACMFSTAVVSIAECCLYSRSAWLGVRLSAGVACIIIVLLSFFVKGQLHRREASASFILTAILAVVASASSTTIYHLLVTSIIVVAVAQAQGPERPTSTVLIVAPVTSISLALSRSNASYVHGLTAVGCALMFVLSASAFQLVRTRASAQRKAFTQHTPSNNRRNTFARQDARRRASGLGKLGLFNQNMGQGSVDAPLQATLEELKCLASGNAKMTAAMQRLTELVTRDRGWDPIARDAFIVQRTVSDDSQSTNAQLGVDAETAEWLEQMVVPGQLLRKDADISSNGEKQFLNVVMNVMRADDGGKRDGAVPASTHNTSKRYAPLDKQPTPEIVGGSNPDVNGKRDRGFQPDQMRRGSVGMAKTGVIQSAELNPLAKLLATSADHDFDVELLEPLTNAHPLLCLFVYFCNCYNLIDSLELESGVLQRYVMEVEVSYRALPYHSVLHAADVLVNAIRLLQHSEYPVSLFPLELLAIITACAVHDMDHLGVNNAFLASTNHEIAIRYNDQSVLENHHLFSAFTLLRKEGTNFLQDFSYTQKQDFRHIVVELVLATDFAFHLKLMTQFKAMVSSLPNRSALPGKEEKLLLWRIIMKAADLGHCSKPMVLHKRWALRVMEEMYRQGESEAKMGFMVSAAMDRSKMAGAPKSQAGFLEFVCLPLFQAWHMFSEDAITLKNVTDNIKMWKEMDAQGKPITQNDIYDALPKARHFRFRKATLQQGHGSPRISFADKMKLVDMDGDDPDGVYIEESGAGTEVDEIVKAKSRPDRGGGRAFATLRFGTLVQLNMAGKRIAKAVRKTIRERKASEIRKQLELHGTIPGTVAAASSAPGAAADAGPAAAVRPTTAIKGPSSAVQPRMETLDTESMSDSDDGGANGGAGGKGKATATPVAAAPDPTATAKWLKDAKIAAMQSQRHLSPAKSSQHLLHMSTKRQLAK